MKRFLLILVVFACIPLSAQVDRKEVRAGNRKFAKEDWRSAEIDYRKAVLKDSLSVAGQYNLASCLYRQEDYEGAGKALEAVGDVAPAGVHGAEWYFNSGDVALQKKDYGAAVKAFREALLRNPGDMAAKENYTYAKMMQQNQQGGSNDQNEDQNQEQKQDEDQNQNKDQNQNQDKNRDQQPQPQEISPQQAQQMLQAVQAKEKETQDKVNKEKAAALQSRQKEKNW